MQYKDNRVFTSKDMMSIIGAKSKATVRSFCKRHGITPTKMDSVSVILMAYFFSLLPTWIRLWLSSGLAGVYHRENHLEMTWRFPVRNFSNYVLSKM